MAVVAEEVQYSHDVIGSDDVAVAAAVVDAVAHEVLESAAVACAAAA